MGISSVCGFLCMVRVGEQCCAFSCAQYVCEPTCSTSVYTKDVCVSAICICMCMMHMHVLYTRYGHVSKRFTDILKNPDLAYLSLCGLPKLGTCVGAAKVTVPVQGDVHQGWPEISCILSGQAAKLRDHMTLPSKSILQIRTYSLLAIHFLRDTHKYAHTLIHVQPLGAIKEAIPAKTLA